MDTNFLDIAVTSLLPDDQNAEAETQAEPEPKTPRRSTAKQRRASRLNGQKSRGPKTAAGKTISRRNALKHGLAGEGRVLLEAEEELIEQRYEEWAESAQPQNAIQRFLLRRAVVASVQLECAEQFETAGRAYRRAEAETREQDQADQAEELGQKLFRDDPHAHKQLRATVAGCEFLIDHWDQLGYDLLDPEQGWDRDRQIRYHDLRNRKRPQGAAEHAFAQRCELAGQAGPEARAFARRMLEDQGLDPAIIAEAHEAADPASRELIELMTLVIAQIGELQAEADRLEAIEGPQRELAAEQSVLDTSPTAILVRRYQTAATSELLRMLQALRKEQALQAELRNEPEGSGQASQVVAFQGSCVEKLPPEFEAKLGLLDDDLPSLQAQAAALLAAERSEAVPRPPAGPA